MDAAIDLAVLKTRRQACRASGDETPPLERDPGDLFHLRR